MESVKRIKVSLSAKVRKDQFVRGKESFRYLLLSWISIHGGDRIVIALCLNKDMRFD